VNPGGHGRQVEVKPFLLVVEQFQAVRAVVARPAFNPLAVNDLDPTVSDQHVVFVGDHLRRILSGYVQHYNPERPRQELGNRPLTCGDASEAVGLPTGELYFRKRVGRLLKHNKLRAAWRPSAPLTLSYFRVSSPTAKVGPAIRGGICWRKEPFALRPWDHISSDNTKSQRQ
jgi:hypothetical protein